MSQLSIGFAPEVIGAGDWKSVLDWAQRAVMAAGHKVAAPALDIAPSTLSDALNERNDKGVKGEWLFKLLRMSSPAMQREFARMVCDFTGHEAPTPKRTMTAEEELAELKRLLAERLGDIGKQLVNEVMGGKR